MTTNGMDLATELLRKTSLFDPDWYVATYPDVRALGMDPVDHFLRYGALLARNPGPRFHTSYYVEKHLGDQTGRLNPLIHYLRQGRKAGLACRDPELDPVGWAKGEVDALRAKLLSLGFTDRPLRELAELAVASPVPAIRCFAARELALWHLRSRKPEGYAAALGHVAAARRDAPDLPTRCKLVCIELLCLHLLGRSEEGRAAYERAALEGEMGPDAMLAWANFQPTPELRLVWINEVLRIHHLAELTLLPERGRSSYDRLTPAAALPEVVDGPKVTVLMAAYEAAGMIDTALRSLQEQTWRNLEILVLDDCSPSPAMGEVVARFAAADPRIRLIRMPVNGGAYVARNHGLDRATGEFVTIHDADDWSHPQKIETQVRFLMEHPDVMGCTSEQARALDDLTFSKLRSGGGFIIANTSSFMFRRAPVRDALGYWDTVRFGADNEFIRRVQKVFGFHSCRKLPTGPLSFQRDAQSSITSDPVKGVDGGYHYYGVRREYYDAQRHHHRTAPSLRYTGDPSVRPFAVPPMMLPQPDTAPARFDVVFAGELRRATPEVRELAERIRALRDRGQRIGLVEVYDYDLRLPVETGMCPEIRSLVDGRRVRVLVYGEEAETASLERIGAGGDLGELRLAPRIRVLS